jgi:hypothetical protein
MTMPQSLCACRSSSEPRGEEPAQTWGLKVVEAATEVPLARRINGRLREAVQRHPGRFGADIEEGTQTGWLEHSPPRIIEA